MPTTDKRTNDPSKSAPVLPDDENRIDWERKQKAKRQDERDVMDEAPVVEEEILDEVLLQPTTKKTEKSKSRKKRRHLVYDEDRGAVVVKRKRRRQTDRLKASTDEWEEWDEEF